MDWPTPASQREKATGVGKLSDGAKLSAVIAKLKTLPSYHPTVVALLGISTENPSAVEEFQAVFQTDPAFASELLQVANSAEFGLRREVESIRHALTLLGLDRVSSLAFEMAMRFYMNRVPSMREMQSVWSHSVATAIIAQALAEACGQRSAGMYSAGLIHDIGKLGLMMIEGQPFVEFCAGEFDSTEQYLARERELLGVTHAEAGRAMAENWGFPLHLCECIGKHHDNLNKPLAKPTDIVACACRFASALNYPEFRTERVEAPEQVLVGLGSDVRRSAHLDPVRLQAAITKALQSVWR